ncbi:hypothetical protein [Kordiimonas pumila]|uniref:Shikimate kinase n=1 Tax=Kordiimonas pumila TaxID=2161677 RepID=A0ABV7D2M7_9PROT|nr:hypothetical protein [Kordiimonas pumila]
MPNFVTVDNSTREKLFQWFKYLIYFMIFLNVFYWLREDYIASAYTFREGFGWQQVGDVFAQALDTFAWLILLIAFEFETSVLSDEKLEKGWKWVLNAIAGICYLFIVLAFLGYVKKFNLTMGFEPLSITDGCAAVGQYLSYAIDLDEYIALTAANCMELTGTLYANPAASMITTADTHMQLEWLATAEVINAGAWILIVLFLWIDMFIQLRGMEHGRLYRVNVVCKFLLYSTLIIVCVYWGFEGNFMDFWDAFLWIVAFFLIEMNIFKWSEEIEAEHLEEEHKQESEHAL